MMNTTEQQNEYALNKAFVDALSVVKESKPIFSELEKQMATELTIKRNEFIQKYLSDTKIDVETATIESVVDSSHVEIIYVNGRPSIRFGPVIVTTEQVDESIKIKVSRDTTIIG